MPRLRCLEIPPEVVAALRSGLRAKVAPDSDIADLSILEQCVWVLNDYMRSIRQMPRRGRLFGHVMMEFESSKVREGRIQRAFNQKNPKGASRGLRDLICLCITEGELDWSNFLSRHFPDLINTLPEPDIISELAERDSGYARKRESARRLNHLAHQIQRTLIDDGTVNPNLWSDGEVDAVIRSALEIATTTLGISGPRQKAAAEEILARTDAYLRKVQEGRIHIKGKEPGYFQRQKEVRMDGPEPEHILAYIRLTAFEPDQLWGKSWFDTVYREYIEDVQAGRLTVDYIFLIHSMPGHPSVLEFIARYEAFATTIAILAETDDRLSADLVVPSIALLTNRRRAFTHDRGPGAILIENDEWLFEKDYDRLRKKYDELSMLSTRIFSKDPG